MYKRPRSILTGSAQTGTVPCFTGLGCGSGSVGFYISGFGWVQNISSDLTSAEPQTEVTAVEGETVTLTLFYTKNNPPNAIRLDFTIQTLGSATGMYD